MRLFAGLAALHRRRRAEVIDDVDAEIRAHLEARVQGFVASGLSPDQARAEALRRFGDVTATRRAMYESAYRQVVRARRRDQLAAALSDARVSLRQLRRSPAFAIGVVATLSLGIAANAAMFDVLDRVLLRPPAHVRNPGRLVRVYLHEMDRGAEVTTTEVSYLRYRELREATRGVIDLVAMYEGAVVAGSGDGARQIRGSVVSPNFASVLGVQPALGRFFADAPDPASDGDAEVVLGHDYWVGAFGGDSTVLGRPIHVGARVLRVIGVAPRGFAGLELSRIDAWIPITAAHAVFPRFDARSDDNSFRWLKLAGRLRDGSTASQAESALGVAYGRAIASTARGADRRPRASVWPVLLERGPERNDGTRVAIWLAAVAVIVLLLACANVANLMLARALSRRGEIAVRVALGVSRGRLIVQLLFESFILAGVAGIAGTLLAMAGGGALRAILMPGLPADMGVNWRLLGFGVSAGFVASLLAGLGPALHGSRADLAGVLAGMGRASNRRSRLRTVLLVAQTAMSTILLVGAGLFVRSLAAARSTDMGFDADRLLVVRLQIRGSDPIPGGLSHALHEFADRLRAVPGVEGAATTVQIPFAISGSTEISVPGVDSVQRFGEFRSNPVGDDYFPTTGTRILAGRMLTRADRTGARRVIVVSDAMARTLWPGQSALGKCVRLGGAEAACSEVVGVAANIHQYDVRHEASLQYWTPEPLKQRETDGPYGVMVRVREPTAMIAAIRTALAPITPATAFLTIRPIGDSVDRAIRPWRLGAVMFGLFGAIGLLIAAVGLYSVLAYTVGQRRRELGIRVALGAVTARVVRLVVAQTLMMAFVGIVIGLVTAALAARWLGALLIGVGPRDPLVLSVVASTLLLTAVAASLFPAWHAARVNPAQALRAD